MSKYIFEKGSSPFFKVLKEKVDTYFSEGRIHPAGNTRLFVKSIVQILSAVALYGVLVFYTPPAIIAVVLCILLGVNLAVIGFNVMHEGGHQTFSRHAGINQLSAYFLNVLGGITYFWKIKHNVNHHTYTNVEGMDSDIDVKPFMRLHRAQPLRKFHRFQHIYGVFLYALSYLAWIFYEDFKKYFSGRISAGGEPKKLPLKEHIIFWLTKLMYVFAYMIIPVIFVGWLSWLIGFLIVAFICGLSTSLVFQLAHVVEGTEFHALDPSDSRHEWAIHQVVSTANFGTRSKLLHWFLGGLNFQIEHHLFPRISHIHYPRISKLVKETCAEYNLAYHEYSSMFRAVVSHLVHLKRLGRA